VTKLILGSSGNNPACPFFFNNSSYAVLNHSDYHSMASVQVFQSQYRDYTNRTKRVQSSTMV
jgi:hypothetical protein